RKMGLDHLGRRQIARGNAASKLRRSKLCDILRYGMARGAHPAVPLVQANGASLGSHRRTMRSGKRYHSRLWLTRQEAQEPTLRIHRETEKRRDEHEREDGGNQQAT